MSTAMKTGPAYVTPANRIDPSLGGDAVVQLESVRLQDLCPRGTQLTQAVSFREAHKGKIALVTIDIGGTT